VSVSLLVIALFCHFRLQLLSRQLILTSNFSAGYYTFQPTFQQMAIGKDQIPQQQQSTSIPQKAANAPANTATEDSKTEAGSK
jgi:hypothetical protein